MSTVLARLQVGGVALCTLLALIAPPRAAAQASDPPPRVSLTFSPLHLLSPQLQVSGEYALRPRVSASVTVGGGRVTEEEVTYRVRELGGQLRAYVRGTFTRGLMLAVDVGHVDASGTPPSAMEQLIGTRVGGAVGYKHTWRRGLTGEVQLGPTHVWGPDGATEWQTIHNVRVGWSF